MMHNLMQASDAILKNIDWLESAPLKKIYALLNQGGEPETLFVGGCVRNAVLGLGIDDIDMASRLTPENVTKRLESQNIKVVPTGLDHGTVTAVLDGQSFEITTLRKDVETDGRHANVAFTDDWLEDAKRRDFTMNTLLADLEGGVFDPLRQGVQDLKRGRVVFVGEPDKRISEDYLRILRFFRFHALYGIGAPDESALKACAKVADKIYGLSKERITQEFFKILTTDNAKETLDNMFENKVLDKFFVSSDQMNFFGHFCDFQKRYGLISLASRLYVLANLDTEHLKSILKYLLCPKVFVKDIQAISQILALPDMTHDHAVQVAIYKFGRVATAQALMIELVQDRVMNGYAPEALNIIQNWDVPNFPVSGEDLKKAGHTPGPDFGQILDRLEKAWIESEFTLNKSALLQTI